MLYFIVFILTIYISTRANLMYENITGVAQIPKYHDFVVIYTIFIACFFAYKMLKIYKKIPLSNHKLYQYIIIITALIMSIGSLFPYIVNGTDIFSKMHVYCSMSSCLSFLILLWIYTRYLATFMPMIYIKIHWYYDLFLQFLSILFIVFTRVNGYIEIIFTFIVCTYLYIIEKNMKTKEDK